MCVEPFESETAVLTLAMFFAAYRETCCELGEGRPPGLDRRARRRWRNERPRSVEMSRAEWSLLFR